MTVVPELYSARLDVPAEIEEFQERMLELGWGDGLPLIPPVPDKVQEFVLAAGAPANTVVAQLPPAFADATVEKIAVNAVMAGCRPEYMPVVIAAVRAAAQEAFNLYAVQTTTHPCAVLLIVGGPIAEQIGMNYGYGAFGPGNRANATIGRAMRLVLLNIGGAKPGVLDRATQGSPAKYTFCVAENERDSPWPSLRESLGYRADESVVTVVAGEPPHNLNDHGSTSAESLLRNLAGAITTTGNNNVSMKGDSYLFLGPEHARQLSVEGLKRADVQSWLFEHARVPRERFSPGQLAFLEGYFDAREREISRDGIPLGGSPEDIRILVLGGDGRHSAWVPTFGITRSCSERIA
jgi:hypothetical protein